MNIRSFHTENKPLQTKVVFSASEGKAIAIQLMADAELKEHVTKVPAFLLCISGEVVFENETGYTESLRTGDCINIEPNIKHRLVAKADSHLLLIK